MEGNYHFKWQAVTTAGIIQGKYEQIIYAKNLEDACDYFTYHHGTLAANEDGVSLVITNISWQP